MLADQVALVTGASSGIGRAVALGLARAGARVIATGRDPARLAATEAALAAIAPVGHRIVVCDATDTAAVQALFRSILQDPGRLDILVHAAGILEPRTLAATDAAVIDRHLAVHVRATLQHLQLAGRLMMARKSGSIITLGSVMATQGGAGFATYAAAKAGLTGASLAAAREYAAFGVRVNVVAPGYIDTPLSSGLSPAERAAREARIALRRFGTAEEVAAAICFLASPQASYITGQVLGVDGGMPA